MTMLKKFSFEGVSDKQIVVFDLDGTIVFDGKTIDSDILSTLLVLDKMSHIIFASARPIRDMLPLLTDFGQNSLIGGNGSMIRHKNQITLTSYIDENFMLKVVNKIHELNLDYIIDYEWNYSAKIEDHRNPILQKLDSAKLADNVAIRTTNVSKVILFNISKELALQFSRDKDVSVLYHEDVQELVITGKGSDKYLALKQVIGDNLYYAFGNDKNDIMLLQNATKGFSVEYPFVQSKNVQIITRQEVCSTIKLLIK
ncbi:HAD hydrolase family protein [Streptococcus pseudoporcinus]|uniref:HAD-superfamily hydrolase n=1 Tax=Streptococcus pseudoporcinus TaxID=361101 RepID=A0A4U9XJ31_9STRE|nr:HAD hydrolase family protein [Streptococcus pseudoporcinus]VTS12458.1 HAD-superfamily hydrolase [Streptococcus pseudoporcinus]VUC64985.1 HAD-superfamily hydrolase [Streptococcus pseudoporcinus]VUC95655.1 HAD-superfamily hydrolase [Streptococcus pseudoporcinus]VUC96049.1 HAD-superfamily hydrolase [Streptococcus pseudoporcinus]